MLHQDNQRQNRNYSQRKKNHLTAIPHCILARTDSIALTNPSAQCVGEFASIRSLLQAPICLRSPESFANCDMAAASCVGSPGEMTNPLQPSCTRSAVQPATLVATTGKLHDMASFTTRPQVSLWVGKMKASARA